MSKTVVARPVNGITINGELEFLLNDNGKILMFDSSGQARSFLLASGVGDNLYLAEYNGVQCQRQPENVDFRRNGMSFFAGQHAVGMQP